jgi:heme/copper-type cytochrome/quinol oxidase subunit 2
MQAKEGYRPMIELLLTVVVMLIIGCYVYMTWNTTQQQNYPIRLYDDDSLVMLHVSMRDILEIFPENTQTILTIQIVLDQLLHTPYDIPNDIPITNTENETEHTETDGGTTPMQDMTNVNAAHLAHPDEYTETDGGTTPMQDSV